MEGWIKLHRKSIDSAIFKSPNLWQVWSYCLMRANHKKTKILFNGEEIVLQPGQFITGRFEGSEDCDMKPSTFRDQMAKLEKFQNLTIKSDNKKSIITIVNWAQYQYEQNLDTKHDSKLTHCKPVNIEANQNEAVSSDTKSDNSPTTAGHRQECNNERNIIYTEIFDLWNTQGITIHKKLTDKTIRKIKSCLKDNALKDIKNAIQNYAFILKSDEYYFTYKWTLTDFLSKGIDKFTDLEIAKNNYRDKRFNKSNNQENLQPGESLINRVLI